MIVIKVNEVPNSRESLRKRSSRAWRINQARLYNQKRLITVFKGEILEEYEVLGYGPDKNEPDRVAFELKEVENSPLKGQKIDYKTSNPCTIINPADYGLQTQNIKKAYHFVDPDVTREQMVEVLFEGLGRQLTDEELRVIYWLGDTEYQTRNILLNIFKELAAKQSVK